tara:strand:+ start:57 stop:275 length:219 start_codon:yes stop_codon:yes gene_type:complete
MKTALDAIIEDEYRQLEYWKRRKKDMEYWTPERVQETIDRLELSLKYSIKHRNEFRVQSAAWDVNFTAGEVS